MTNKRIIEVLEKAVKYFRPYNELKIQELIHRSPAEELRHQANEIENREHAVHELRNLLSELQQEEFEKELLLKASKGDDDNV